MRRFLGLLLLSGAAAVVGVTTTSAHHSSAAYDASYPLTLDGVITSVNWRNPHSFVYIDVKDESGATTKWGLETVSPALFAQRVSPSLLKPGVRMIAKVTGPRDRTQHIAALLGFTIDGKYYNSAAAGGREGRGE
jgi:hypothetical protein